MINRQRQGGHLMMAPGFSSGGHPLMDTLSKILGDMGQVKGLQALGIPKAKAGWISMLPESLQAQVVQKITKEQDTERKQRELDTQDTTLSDLLSGFGTAEAGSKELRQEALRQPEQEYKGTSQFGQPSMPTLAKSRYVTPETESSFGNALQLRKKIQQGVGIGKGRLSLERVTKSLLSEGRPKEFVELVTSPNLTENIAVYLLSKTGGDKKKAMAIAKKFGFSS